MTVVIYGLCVDRCDIRYVGRTTKEPIERLRRHIWQARCNRGGCQRWVSRWIRSVDYAVTIVVLEADPADPRQAERDWIEKLRAEGCVLTNLTHGGEGAPPRGFLLSPAQRAKISAANRRRWADPAKREELAESNRQGVTGMKGKKHSAETRERIGAHSRGIKRGSPSLETRRKMSESAKRRCARGVVMPI